MYIKSPALKHFHVDFMLLQMHVHYSNLRNEVYFCIAT